MDCGFGIADRVARLRIADGDEVSVTPRSAITHTAINPQSAVRNTDRPAACPCPGPRPLEREPHADLADALFRTTEVARELRRLQQRRIRRRPARRDRDARLRGRLLGLMALNRLNTSPIASMRDAAAEAEQPSRRAGSSATGPAAAAVDRFARASLLERRRWRRCPRRSRSTSYACAGISVGVAVQVQVAAVDQVRPAAPSGRSRSARCGSRPVDLEHRAQADEVPRVGRPVRPELHADRRTGCSDPGCSRCSARRTALPMLLTPFCSV